MSYLLDIQHVTKEYQNTKAVDDVSISIPASCIFGLLGPNGAGKTSLIRMITGITRPDAGSIKLENKNLSHIENLPIGYMPEERGLYKKMKVGEQLIYLCRLKGLTKENAEKNVVEWMKKFEIQSWFNKKVDELSKGMSQKIQFISTVAHNPKLIILDEPFSGLDPINSNLIKDEIIRLKNEGACILFSTHRMEQVEELCEEIVLMNKGKVILNGPVQEIRHRYKENKFELISNQPIDVSALTEMNIVHHDGPTMVIQSTSEQTGNDILKMVYEKNIPIISFRELLPTFNEIFIRTVNSSNHE